MEAHSSILAWKIPWREELGGYSSWGHKESDSTEWLTFSLFTFISAMELKTKSIIPFTLAPPKIKYLDINLTKYERNQR